MLFHLASAQVKKAINKKAVAISLSLTSLTIHTKVPHIKVVILRGHTNILNQITEQI